MLPLRKSSIVTSPKASSLQPNLALHAVATPKKVLYIVNDLSIGGAEMMLYKLLAECDRERFQPVVISLIDRGALRKRIEALGIEVLTTRMIPGLPSPLGLVRLVRLMRRVEPELVVGWMYHSCFAAQIANFFLPRRATVLWSIHYSISSLASEKKLTAAVIRISARLSRLASHVIFVSRASRIQHKPLRYHLNKSSVIPNGINVKEFVPSTACRASVRSELGLADDAFLVGLIGRYHPMKDHANFLQAAALISAKHSEVHFLLIGRGVDHHNRRLRHSIEKLGLAHRTHLLGERDDIPRLAAALDIFSLSSAYGESFPNVIGEAMACEVCCVVTDVGDADWIIGNAGCVVPPRDPRALADAWEQMIEIGPAGRKALGRAARSRVIEHFTLKSVVARYHALFDKVLATELSKQSELAAIAEFKCTLDDDDVRDFDASMQTENV